MTTGQGVLLGRMADRYDLENDLISQSMVHSLQNNIIFLNILVLFK